VLRYVDATLPELSEALGDADPFGVLVRACGTAAEVARVFANGFAGGWLDPDAPGFLRYLILSCAVVARADSNAETKDFRRNLAAALGPGACFGRLDALPDLWARLVKWCAHRRSLGEPVREISLPELRQWEHIGKHVGLTQFMTFPAWRDLKHLRSVAGHDTALQQIVDPFEAARRLPQLIESDSGFTEAMRKAGEEYRRLYEAHASMLHVHRFWKAVRGILNTTAPRSPRPKYEPHIEMRFALDLDDTEMALSVIDAESGLPSEREESRLTESPDRAVAMLPQWFRGNGFVATSSPLVRLVLEDAVPFFEERFGVWVADFRRPDHPRRCIVLYSNRGGGAIRKIAPLSKWIGERCGISAVLTPLQVQQVFSELGKLVGIEGARRSRNADVRVSGGFKTGSAYLGRASLLPRVAAPDGGGLTMEAVRGDTVAVALEKSPAGDYRIVAGASLSGTYRLRYEERVLEGVDPLVCEKTVMFVAEALEHTELRRPDPQRWISSREMSEDRQPTLPLEPSKACDREQLLQDEALSARFDDFLEAVYASGRSGWSEIELIETMREVLGSDRPSPWDVLRSLEESAWLTPAQAVAWRARRWWLQPPTLLVGDSPEPAHVVLRGSASAAVRRRFVTTAGTLGATVVVRAGVGPCSPRTLIAAGVPARRLGEELGWPLVTAPKWPSAPAPESWLSEVCDPSSHRLVARWDWNRGGFVAADSLPSDGVQLGRFVRARGDRCDIFSVTDGVASGVLTGASRVVAIAEAYRRTRIPFLVRHDDLLLRLPTDGHLPLPVARSTVVRMSRTSGPVRSSGRWAYAYPTDDWCVAAICRVLGAAFVSMATTIAPANLSVAEAVGRSRHRRSLDRDRK